MLLHLTRGAAITLRSGTTWFPYDPSPAEVCYLDFPTIARIPRWGGATKDPYYVGEHCCRVVMLLRAWGASRHVQLQGLTHDGHEIYPPYDWPGPGLVGDAPEANMLRHIEGKAKRAYRAAIRMPERYEPIVRKADLTLLATERRDLMPLSVHQEEMVAGYPDPLRETIEPWSWQEAEARWMELYETLGGHVPA